MVYVFLKTKPIISRVGLKYGSHKSIKKRGDCIRYSLHSWGPRNCPSCQNEQPKTPRRYEYTIYSPLPIPHHITHRDSIQQRQGYSDNHTHGHLSLLCPLTRIEKFPRLSAVREQARDKRLLYVLDQHLPPITRFIQLCHVNDVAVLGTAWVALSDITREHVWHWWLCCEVM